MKFCTKCGKEVDELAKFCSFCGSEIEGSSNMEKFNNPTVNTSNVTKSTTNLARNTVKGIGTALTLIGLIAGFFTITFMGSRGEAFGYDTWNYEYAGGKETAMLIAFFSGASFLIGLCMLIMSSNSDEQ